MVYRGKTIIDGKEGEMKLSIVIPIVFFILMMIPIPVSPTDSQSLPAAIWKVEQMQAWGVNNIAIDFGIKGVWSYNGSWVQLSRLDPHMLESWGGHKLAVDFGSYGLWTYDGRSWEKIA